MRWTGLKNNLADQLERDIATECIQALEWAGWYCRQVENRKRIKRGFSDWVIIRSGRVVFLEFKTETGRQSKEQIEFMDAVQRHGGEYRVARNLKDLIDLLKR